MALRILIADDHPIVPAGLRGLLHGRPGWEVCGEAASAAELLSATEALRPDIVLTDYHMPAPNAKDGIRLLRALRRCLPQGRHRPHHDHQPGGAARHPAHRRARTGAQDAPPAEMALAIAQVQRGLFYVGRSALRILAAALGYGEPGEPGLPGLQGLSPREIEVLRLYLNGSSLTDIARASHRSIKTVSSQKLSAMRKLGACNDQSCSPTPRTAARYCRAPPLRSRWRGAARYNPAPTNRPPPCRGRFRHAPPRFRSARHTARPRAAGRRSGLRPWQDHGDCRAGAPAPPPWPPRARLRRPRLPRSVAAGLCQRRSGALARPLDDRRRRCRRAPGRGRA